jgi:hypothetical protein
MPGVGRGRLCRITPCAQWRIQSNTTPLTVHTVCQIKYSLGHLSKLEAELLERPWQQVRPGVEVKVLPQEKELYLLAQSRDRRNKERAMRRRQLKGLCKRLKQLHQLKLTASTLLLKDDGPKAEQEYRDDWHFTDEDPYEEE